MNVKIENPKKSTKHMLELISEYSKVVAYKVNIQNLTFGKWNKMLLKIATGRRLTVGVGGGLGRGEQKGKNWDNYNRTIIKYLVKNKIASRLVKYFFSVLWIN